MRSWSVINRWHSSTRVYKAINQLQCSMSSSFSIVKVTEMDFRTGTFYYVKEQLISSKILIMYRYVLAGTEYELLL